ncbi:MAG: pyrophosphate--fructose-6-phosphate 1-phosphotransferase [Zhengella sp.]|uniref:pyrophosphate--fructose-6-phosphate 1-phosphotransferase n=1 Tax=Zhengella sp. TaxID=2282762 RepID=UPI001D5D3085|nr:pyrophosphate--fructose-6-phosphate 1-phosphotransferase [Notoacmeibacter sp.]MCC0026934.1 pyrophosphate--fructose-6-phosphate 1-phosphotransferase [Brucellaceae bacterium]
MPAKQKIALLTAGGLAPCLSAAVGCLIERYSEIAPDIEIIAYRSGYTGLLKGDILPVTPQIRESARALLHHGGSPIGNSRVKLTNAADCERRGLVRKGENPLDAAARRLEADGVTILHTIGGDDTNTTAADLAAHLEADGFDMTVVGLPKTVDNDISPVRQSLGALTAAQVGARFFDHVSNEQSATPNTFVVHEIMGRHCGWLTAATLRAYNERIEGRAYCEGLMMNHSLKDVEAVYIPEMPFEIDAEIERLSKAMADTGYATIFVSEGACVGEIMAEREARGETLERDAFGHVRLDSVNVGEWFASRFARSIGADKTLVQKSGYYARSAPANADDLHLIKGMVDHAVASALEGRSGVVGHDEGHGGQLRTIELDRIAGGKPFDPQTAWFRDILARTGQA